MISLIHAYCLTDVCYANIQHNANRISKMCFIKMIDTLILCH